MNKSLLTLLAILVSTLSWGQGVHFETGTWEEVVAKAKAQNKLIYVDVFTTWCGPCKAMARNIFPNEDAGKKYNELFINYKTDAEKEGRPIASKYSVSAYPTNLYINPHTLEVVYRVAGGCGVEEFIARADRAVADFSDPLSWDDYNKKLMSKDVTKDFVMKYIDKARRTGQHHDKALDVYMDKFLSPSVSDEELAFLVTNTTTYDNKAFPYLKKQIKRVNEIFKDRPQFFENHMRTTLFQGTFKKAVDVKDIKVLETAKPIIQEYSSANPEGAWLGFMARYYETLGQQEELYKALQKATTIYAKVKPADYPSKDAEMLASHRKNIENELTGAGVPADQLQAQIDKAINTKPDLKNSFTSNAINTYNAGIQYLIKQKVTDKKKLTEGLTWAKNMTTLSQSDINMYPASLKQLAWVHYQLGNKKEAVASIQKAIDFLKTNNKPTQAFDNDIQLINEGKYELQVK